MKDIYEEAFRDELQKIAEDEKKPSRLRSAAKGALAAGLGIGTLGALAGGAAGIRSYSKAVKKISKKFSDKAIRYKKRTGKRMPISPGYGSPKSQEGLAALSAMFTTAAGGAAGAGAGAAIGGTRGALYPKGRKTMSGKRSKVGS